MERFAIKIDKKLKANLYKICRLCGIDNPDMVPIISDQSQVNESCIDVEVELEMNEKINILLGLSITKDDRMPQTMCCLCVDKINDFYEFREMCYATNAQTRKLLGLKSSKKPALDIKPKVEIKEESIVPTPIPIPTPTPTTAYNKNNKKRKSEEVASKDEKPDVTPIQPKKKLRFSASAESIIKEETLVQTKKKAKNNTVEDTKLKKEPSPPVSAAVMPLAVSNKKLRLVAPPQKELALKKSKQKAVKNAEAEVKEEIKEEVKEEPPATTTQPLKVTIPAKVPQPPKLKFGCNICKERFSAKVILETHRATHIPKVERYVCTACNEILSKSFDIKNHQLWHKLSKTPYVCGRCGESILNTYAFSRHLREHAFDTPPALLVLDRECPQCHISYATNFLYNIHICAVKTRRCAGCNRLQRNDAEYLRHSAQCAKVYLNYSKHIMPSVEALEDAVRIKNENDVEAAAEEMARISGVSLDMAPVVQLTRLSSPIIMAASLAVSATGLDDIPNASNKKSSKKGVSKKDLRRVDELLKSTLDALVSIKHEPEVHVDQEAPCVTEQSDNEEHEKTDDHDGGLDDFHYNNDTDSENEESNAANANKFSVAEEGVKIKQENDEVNEENANKIGGGLKLKIKKEHGQLNSSIIEQQKSSDKRAEKRKKKKKHKEKEKDKHRFSKDNQDEQNNIINSNANTAASTIRIKVEPQDGSDFGEKSIAGTPLQQRLQPEATIMTSIPMMQFQIACVSSGVEFNNASNPVIESQPMSSTNHDVEPEDIKPNRQELDRMLKISHVSSGITMETNETEEIVAAEMDHDGNYDDKRIGDEEDEDDYQRPDENESEQEEDESENTDETQKESANEIENNEGYPIESTEDNKKKAVVRKTKPKPKVSLIPKEAQLSIVPRSRNKACKSTSKPQNLPVLQISAVQSGVTLEPTSPTTSEISQIFIKPEPQNRGYSDEQPPVVTSPSRLLYSEEQEDGTEDFPHAHTTEEENYISTIDFNNIMIKQEKDIEIHDVQITQKSVKSIAKLNGLKRKRKQVRDKSLELEGNLENNDKDEENRSDEDYEESNSEASEEEEEAEEEEEEDEEMVEDDYENEEREYRELEYPPKLAEDNKPEDEAEGEDNLVTNENNENLKGETSSEIQEISKEEDKVPFVITNICTQASTDNYEQNLIKITEEDITKDVPIQQCKDAKSLRLSNISEPSDFEIKQQSLSSDKQVDTVTSSGERFPFDSNMIVPNDLGLHAGFEGEMEVSESQRENTHDVVGLTSVSPQLQANIQSFGKTITKLSSTETRRGDETHSQVQCVAQNLEQNLEELINPEAQSEQFVDQIIQDIQAIMPQEPGKLYEYSKLKVFNKTKNYQEETPQATSDVHDSNDRYNLQNAAELYLEMKSASQQDALENLPNIQNSEYYSQHQPVPNSLQTVSEITSSAKIAVLINAPSELEPCLQSNNDSFEISKDNQEDNTATTIEGVIQQSKDASLEALPVTEHFVNESVENYENEEDYDEDEEESEQVDNEEESTLAPNLEERQNDQNQEVLSQIRPTALALHPYLEDISSSSNSLLSNSLSQTPPPQQLLASAAGVNNDFNSQRLLDTEETENILNESNEAAETLAMSVSHPLTQPMLGQPLPPQMPTFNFDNINEIAENNNNANIEREQLQDEQHQQQN